MGIFDDPEYNKNRYGESDSIGSPEEWSAAYDERMGRAEAEQVLEDFAVGRTHREAALLTLEITEIRVDTGDVKVAYRKIVMLECKAAFDLDPDPKVVARFKEVNAAYSLLLDIYGED